MSEKEIAFESVNPELLRQAFALGRRERDKKLLRELRLQRILEAVNAPELPDKIHSQDPAGILEDISRIISSK